MPHPPITLVIGGCRSGKSRHAQRLAEETAPERIYVATCEPGDEEMRERIRQHQSARGAGWRTVEEPLDLPAAITAHAGPDRVLLVDCLTLWVSNLLTSPRSDGEALAHIHRLVPALARARGPVILVSNEVGMGIVPAHPLSRQFRDLAGFLNQKVAEAGHRVIWTVAGIPVTIKPALSTPDPPEGSVS